MSERDGEFVATHVAAFNQAVVDGEFRAFLLRFADDAVIRFQNLPGGINLEFAGRNAYTRAYSDQPPDDQMDIAGPVTADGPRLAVPFAWRRDGARGTMQLTQADGLITEMNVIFE